MCTSKSFSQLLAASRADRTGDSSRRCERRKNNRDYIKRARRGEAACVSRSEPEIDTHSRWWNYAKWWARLNLVCSACTNQRYGGYLARHMVASTSDLGLISPKVGPILGAIRTGTGRNRGSTALAPISCQFGRPRPLESRHYGVHMFARVRRGFLLVFAYFHAVHPT